MDQDRASQPSPALFYSTPVFVFLLFTLSFYADNFLDDTYISLSYASNLLHGRGWTFAHNPTPSYGATAPLWVGVLAVALAAAQSAVPAIVIAKMCSLFFGTIAVLVVGVMARRFGWAGLLMAVAFAVEPNLARYASNGMETSMAIVLMLIATELAFSEPSGHGEGTSGLLFGVVTAATYLLRPESIALMAAFLGYRFVRGQLRFVMSALPVVTAIVGGWLFYCYVTFDQIVPNTAYAKGLYLPLASTPLTAFLPRFGSTALLVSAWPVAAWVVARARRIGDADRYDLRVLAAAGVAWCVYAAGFWLTNAYIDPRYLVVGVAPVAWWLLFRTGLKHYTTQWAAAVTALLTIGAIAATAALYMPAKTAYVKANLALVDIAEWLQTNTAPDARVAIKDIGAVGFASNRYVLDLAGLASRDAIPFHYGQEGGCELVDRERIDYLVLREPVERWRTCPFTLMRMYAVAFPMRNLGMLREQNTTYTVWRIERS